VSASQVFVVFPSGLTPLAATAGLRRWLSRGDVVAGVPGREPLLSVLDAIGEPSPGDGLAALRYRGQTGVDPEGWLAAADPAHLETRLRHLVLRPFRPGEVAVAELSFLFESMRAFFATDELEFEHVEGLGYLRSVRPFATASCSAAGAGGRLPDEFMPGGGAAAAFHRLQGEMQMLLHDHPVNQRRRQGGRPEINTLWLWGGGSAGDGAASPLPDLLSDDPLFRGYWASRGQSYGPFVRDFATARGGGKDLVVTIPDERNADPREALQRILAGLRKRLRSGRAGSVTVFFGDGLVIRLARSDGLRFWRGVSPYLQASETDV
jgi:hypothetical protein